MNDEAAKEEKIQTLQYITTLYINNRKPKPDVVAAAIVVVFVAHLSVYIFNALNGCGYTLYD